MGNKSKELESDVKEKSFEEYIKQLEDNYGIHIIKGADEKIDKKKYRKATKEEKQYISQLLSYIPSYAKDQVQINNAKKMFEEAVKDTYRIVIPEDCHLANSRTISGALKGLAFDCNNHNADLRPQPKNIEPKPC